MLITNVGKFIIKVISITTVILSKALPAIVKTMAIRESFILFYPFELYLPGLYFTRTTHKI